MVETRKDAWVCPTESISGIPLLSLGVCLGESKLMRRIPSHFLNIAAGFWIDNRWFKEISSATALEISIATAFRKDIHWFWWMRQRINTNESEAWTLANIPPDWWCLRNRLNRSELRVEVNEEDRRAAAYIALYGFERLEVDAIPSAEIQSGLRSAIKERIDQDAWAESEQKEAKEREQLQNLEWNF